MLLPPWQRKRSAPAPKCSCASSGRAWRLWAARYSQEAAGPLGSSVQPTGRPAMAPRLLELAAPKAADVTPPPLTMQVGEVDFRYFEETPMAARARYAMPYRALEPRTSRQ